jgi:ATP-dependent DNA ligase
MVRSYLKAAHAVQKRLDVFMWAFDLIELNGDDLRRDPLNVRKATLASVLARAAPGLRLNERLPSRLYAGP